MTESSHELRVWGRDFASVVAAQVNWRAEPILLSFWRAVFCV